MSGTTGALPRQRVKPPGGPMVDPRTGEPTPVWLAYIQDLSDRLQAEEDKAEWLRTRLDAVQGIPPA